MKNSREFDASAFYQALATTADRRGLTWKQVSVETGVSASTLSRMSNGAKPDAGSLAVLAAWAGLDPTQFVSGSRGRREPLAMVGKLLREDPNLDARGAEALEAIIKTAYESLSSAKKSGKLR